MTRRIAILAGLAVLAAGAFLLLRPSTDPEADGPAPSTIGAGDHLIVDGWSQTILSATTIDVAYHRTGTVDPAQPLSMPEDAADAETIELTPLTEADLAELLRRDPATVEQLLSRLATADPALACTADGCTDSNGDVPVSWLADLTTIPGYGAMYDAWGITHGAYAAPVTIEADATVAALTVNGWDALSVDFADGAGDLFAGDPDAPKASTGNVRAVAAGFGRLFPLTAIWQTPHTTTLPGASFGPSNPVGIQNGWTPAGSKTVPPLGRGPAVADDAAAGLDPIQLNALSAPATGCAPTVLCTPLPVSIRSTQTGTVAGTVCDTASSPYRTYAQVAAIRDQGEPVEAVQLGVVLRSAEWTFTLPAPIHQARQWGDKTPAGGDRNVWHPGPAPLFHGSTMTVNSAELYDSDRILVGVDGAPSTDSWDIEGLLELSAGRLTRCPDGTPDVAPAAGPTISGPGGRPNIPGQPTLPNGQPLPPIPGHLMPPGLDVGQTLTWDQMSPELRQWLIDNGYMEQIVVDDTTTTAPATSSTLPPATIVPASTTAAATP